MKENNKASFVKKAVLALVCALTVCLFAGAAFAVNDGGSTAFFGVNDKGVSLSGEASAETAGEAAGDSGESAEPASGAEAAAVPQSAQRSVPSAGLDVPACSCGEGASENLADHDDTCLLKAYCDQLINGAITTVSSVWKNLPDMAKAYVWAGLSDEGRKTMQSMGITWDEPEAKVVLRELDALDARYESLSEDDCEDFYADMMSAYSKAFVDDVPVVSGEELAEIDSRFGVLQEKLYKDFGYSEVMLTAGASGDGDSSTPEGSIVVDKTVSTNGDVSDFLLTLESYVTGDAVDVVQPVDLVLALDQSASMYDPIGLHSGLGNAKLYEESPDTIVRYIMDPADEEEVDGAVGGCRSLKEALGENAKDSVTGLTFKEKISQLGYLVAQSRTGATHYDENKATYDWFVVQYVEDDPEGPWHLYRTKQTACPSTDINMNFKYEGEKPIKLTDKQLGEHHYYFYESQSGALYDAITSFAATLQKSGGDHRLAVTGFSSGIANPEGDKEGTCGAGVYVGEEFIPYSTVREHNGKPGTRWNWITDAKTIYEKRDLEQDPRFGSALMSVQDDYPRIAAAMKSVKTDYYETFQNVGFDIALQILKNSGSVEGDLVDRKKIVVLFTDGEPSGPKKGDVVAKAAELKEIGAEVYTVCTSTLPEDKRAFLTCSSSDYPEATGTVGADEFNPGEPISEAKYAKTAESADGLVDEFLNIIEDMGGADIELGAEAVLRDEIADGFTLPKDLLEKLRSASGAGLADIGKYVRVYTADCVEYKDGLPEFDPPQLLKDAKVEIRPTGSGDNYRVIQVSGFNYSENFVSKNGRGENDFRGKKLIVEIAIDVADGNLGGNYQPTNVEANSGVYNKAEGSNLKPFPVPHVDVPTNVTVSKTVVGTDADKSQEFEFSATYAAGGEYEPTLEDGATYLKLSAPSASDNGFVLADGGAKTLENVKVGETLTIKEADSSDFATKVEVFDAEGDKIVPENNNGSYSVAVVPGMKISYTNTRQLTDLVISKSGINTDLDSADGGLQSTLFKVFSEDGFELEVTIVGNGSATIKDIPVGEYTVTELTNWSWRYDVVGDASQTVEAKSEGSNTVSFTNKRTNDKWLSGDCYCENWWRGVSEVVKKSLETTSDFVAGVSDLS